MIIYLIRHMRVEGAEGICYGRTDMPVAPGQDRRIAMLPALLPKGLWLVWTSPALRCRQLASTLAPFVRVESRVQELDFGSWEGRLWNEISRAEIDVWAADPVGLAPPGGETYQSLQERASAAMDDIVRASTGRVPIVCTHAGVIRALLARSRGFTLAQSLEVEVPFGSIHSIEWREPADQ